MIRCRALLLLLLLAFLPACAVGQTADTTRIPVPYDSTWRVIDSVVVRADTFAHDTTAHLTRDSLVIVVRPPAAGHPGEPAGFLPLLAHDFGVPIVKDQPYRLQGQAGCWYAHSGGAFVNGKYAVTFAVGLGEGRTPNKLEAFPVCPPAAKASSSFYVHLIGYQPGDGTPAWVNGEGTKALFVRYGNGAPLIFKCDAPNRPSGVKASCHWSLYTNAGTKLKASGQGVVVAGRPNDVACLLEARGVTCWVNGATLTWAQPAGGATGVWLDWTYGGGGGGTPVGVRSVWSLEGVYASGR